MPKSSVATHCCSPGSHILGTGRGVAPEEPAVVILHGGVCEGREPRSATVDRLSPTRKREFSWCCSFLWGFGCRGTERRLASWRAAAQCSGSQSGRPSGAGLHSGVQTTHLTRSRTRCDDARRPGHPSPPRRSVLVSADLLAARTGPWNPRGSDSTETRAEVQAQPHGRRSPETSPTKRPLDR